MRFHIVLLLFLACLHATKTKRLVVQVTRCTFPHYNPHYVDKLACEVGRNQKGFYVSAQFLILKNVSEFDISFALDILRVDGSKINLGKYSMPGCKFLSTANTVSPFKFLVKKLFQSTNIPRRCPVKAGLLLTVRNFSISDGDSDYPPIFMSMSFVTNLTLSLKNRVLLMVAGEGKTIYV